MEATQENFDMLLLLFDDWASALDRDSPVLRRLKKAKSDGKEPRGSPQTRRYHVASKGFVVCRKEPARKRSGLDVLAAARPLPSSTRVVRRERRFEQMDANEGQSVATVLGDDADTAGNFLVDF